jgi:hypothetical protein
MNPLGSDQYKHFIELLNRYPSPHNGQPMILEPMQDGKHDVYFDTSRGLTATPISNLFSFVTVGVFFRYVELCAAAAGLKVSSDIALPKVDEMGTGKRLSCGSFRIEQSSVNPDTELATALEFRQTSRKKYDEGLTAEEQAALTSVGSGESTRLMFLNHADSMKAVWLNQRAVFDDMFDTSVRTELKHWMRFDPKEKIEKKDGLAYDCMELSGASLKFVFKHYRILHWPVIKGMLRRYYIRTMKDSSTVGYMSAPFETEDQAYEIGRRVMDVWIELSKRGKYLHPFGTIVSNDEAHKEFARLVGLNTEDRASNYIVFIFRAGMSEKPVVSERIDIKNHLLKGAEL